MFISSVMFNQIHHGENYLGYEMYVFIYLELNNKTFVSILYTVLKGVLVSHNTSARVVRSNQSLVLQKVTRQSSGRYSCSAINSEGETISDEFILRVKC